MSRSINHQIMCNAVIAMKSKANNFFSSLMLFVVLLAAMVVDDRIQDSCAPETLAVSHNTCEMN